MRAVLEAWQKAAAVRVEELEAELEQLRAALAKAEEVLRHRVIGLEQYLEALAEEDAPTVAAVSSLAVPGLSFASATSRGWFCSSRRAAATRTTLRCGDRRTSDSGTTRLSRSRQ